ncbi:MAG TPA: hypothetical protein VFU76_15620 [Terriglobales bacterium]|nr:hypothetical protein [Terriglobales bacterium]
MSALPVPSPQTKTDREHVHILSALTLGGTAKAARQDDAVDYAAALTPEQRKEFVELADSHHVVVRGFTALARRAALEGNADVSAWAATVLDAEHARIDNALQHLDQVVRELEANGCPTTVIKSLDHWPDLGNDLDLYTTADPEAVIRVFTRRLNAKVEPRSWGDRLAQKWNFAIPGLREAVECHCQRLGQTGEHIDLAQRFSHRRVYRDVQGYTFPVPAPEERVVVATLQRMYRHFYFRISDMANSASLVDAGAVNFTELQSAANIGGIWPGVATYLQIVSDYVRKYRGKGLTLPREVVAAARFGGEKLFVRKCFLRVPIMPDGAKLYTKQISSTALRGNVPATFRLSLLPPLASAAAISFKLTGSDKGIW